MQQVHAKQMQTIKTIFQVIYKKIIKFRQQSFLDWLCLLMIIFQIKVQTELLFNPKSVVSGVTHNLKTHFYFKYRGNKTLKQSKAQVSPSDMEVFIDC